MSHLAQGGASATAHPGRGRVALALAAAAAGVALIATPAWHGLAGSDDARPAPSAAPALSAPPVFHANRKRGYSLRVPATWRVEERPRVTRIVSPDRSVVVAIASPTSGRFPARVGRDAELALAGASPPARLVRRSPGRLGRLRVRTTELARPAAAGRSPARILSIAGASRWRTYSIQVVTAMPPNSARFVEAGRLLASIRLTRPARR
jgi:hypothetical protein